MRALIDLTDKTFGRLTVLKRDANGKRGQPRWLCKCDCGNRTIVDASKLKSGHTKSCGCLVAETLSKCRTKHNGKHTRLYRIWCAMKERCSRKENVAYNSYGGRGIKVCDEWIHDFASFRDWATANGYSDQLSIDRIDPNGNYCPQNCRWESTKTQANNKRRNHSLTHNGKTMTLAQWAEETGINYSTLRSRINREGLTLEEAITKG